MLRRAKNEIKEGRGQCPEVLRRVIGILSLSPDVIYQTSCIVVCFLRLPSK
jgi:hypothetical protein